MCSTWRWRKGDHSRESLVPLTTRLLKLRSNAIVCICLWSHVCVSACVTLDMCDEVGMDMGIGHNLTGSILSFRKLLVWAHSEAGEDERQKEGESSILQRW